MVQGKACPHIVAFTIMDFISDAYLFVSVISTIPPPPRKCFTTSWFYIVYYTNFYFALLLLHLPVKFYLLCFGELYK